MTATNNSTGSRVNAEIANPPRASGPVRIWPAVLIALIHLMVAFGFSRLSTTNIQNAIALGGVPLAATLLYGLWWLFASRTPLLDRFVGLGVFLAGAGAIVFSQQTSGRGAMLLALALPALTYGLVIVLVLTYALRWPVRRWVLVAFLAAGAATFCAMRVDSIGGDLAPVTAWRWTPTAAVRSAALPHLDTQRTAMLPEQADAADWPAFRGARRDGRVSGVRISSDWSNPPRELWRREIGSAWSSFILVGDYLFTQEQRGAEELVSCYEADTGAPVWHNRIAAEFEDAMGLGPRATPTFADGRLYTLGGTGILQCLDAATGESLWQRDVALDAGTRVPGYGFSGSPLVTETLVVVFTAGGEGNSVLAYQRGNGEVVWRAGTRTSGYASPQLEVVAGVQQVLMVSDAGIEAFEIENGATLWEHHWQISTNPRCVQPVVMNGAQVMFGGTGVSGSRLLRVTQQHNDWTVEEQWTTRRFRPYFNNGVLHKRHYYGYDGERVGCLDMETGERRWSGERYSGQLLLLEDMDMLLVLSEAGYVALVEATPERYNEVARFKALTGKTWNHPVVARNRLFVRNAREAACFELPALTNPQ